MSVEAAVEPMHPDFQSEGSTESVASAPSEKIKGERIKPGDPTLLSPIEQRRQLRMHYYIKILVCTFLCALLLVIGVPVFMESRVTGSLAYTALGVVLVGFGLVLAASVVTLLFRPPFNKDGSLK